MTNGFCPCCETDRTFRSEQRRETFSVRGVEIKLDATVEICETCGQARADEAHDQLLVERAYAGYRHHKGLLFPEEIRSIRERFALSQRSFATLLGMSEATINRYEGGALQEDTHDGYMRLASTASGMLTLLDRRGHLLSDSQRARALEALRTQVQEDFKHQYTSQSESASDRGNREFSFDRYALTAVWFCQKLKRVHRTQMNKLLFYTDFLSFKEFGRSITGSPYRRLQFGPVPMEYGRLEDALSAQDFIVIDETLLSYGEYAYVYTAGPAAGKLDVTFTPDELRVLEHVASTIGPLGSVAASERSHQEAAWLKTSHKALISFQHAEALSLSLP